MRRILILRHGILLNRYMLLPMERYFRRKGYEVYNRSYRSTRKLVEEHALDLSAELGALEEEASRRGDPHEIYFITHSLAGLVLRHALTHFPMPPIRRGVMLVPPSCGSATARLYRDYFFYRWTFGQKSGRQLGETPGTGIFEACGVPDGVELGVIAGSIRWKLYPGKLEKPHDGILSVSEASLPPYPLKVLPYGHTPILFVRSAWEEAEHFLEHGKFRG